MAREEAIEELKSELRVSYRPEKREAIEMAIALLKDSVPQGVVDQMRWERDTALSQLKEIGKGLGEKMDDIVAMLKEQEPVCVKESKINKCACGNIINRYYHPKFCGFCGRELLWY